jgi:hypothetical protein
MHMLLSTWFFFLSASRDFPFYLHHHHHHHHHHHYQPYFGVFVCVCVCLVNFSSNVDLTPTACWYDRHHMGYHFGASRLRTPASSLVPFKFLLVSLSSDTRMHSASPLKPPLGEQKRKSVQLDQLNAELLQHVLLFVDGQMLAHAHVAHRCLRSRRPHLLKRKEEAKKRVERHCLALEITRAVALDESSGDNSTDWNDREPCITFLEQYNQPWLVARYMDTYTLLVFVDSGRPEGTVQWPKPVRKQVLKFLCVGGDISRCMWASFLGGAGVTMGNIATVLNTPIQTQLVAAYTAALRPSNSDTDMFDFANGLLVDIDWSQTKITQTDNHKGVIDDDAGDASDECCW